MNNSKNQETCFKFFCWANIEINLWKDGGKSSKSAFVMEISLFQIFLLLQWSWKNMTKSTNILEFISILQFSQMHPIFEINISKEIKKMIAKNYKKL